MRCCTMGGDVFVSIIQNCIISLAGAAQQKKPPGSRTTVFSQIGNAGGHAFDSSMQRINTFGAACHPLGCTELLRMPQLHSITCTAQTCFSDAWIYPRAMAS